MALTKVNRKLSSVPSILDNGTGSDVHITIASDGSVAIDESLTVAGNTVMHLGNDGAGSNFDADKLDGQHGSHFRINIYNASGTLLN